MGLADEVRAQPPYHKRQWVDEQLGPEEAAELAELLADPNVSPTHIANALRTRGIVIPTRTVFAWAYTARSRA